MSKEVILAFVLVGTISSAIAEDKVTFEQLMTDDQFRSKAWLTPSETVAIGQQIELNIELSTSRWFSAGTRIGKLEMDDAIVLKRNKFAVNSTTRERGVTWSTQLWTLTIYPQRDGAFSVPEVTLDVSVAGEEGASLMGTVTTPALYFTATVPSAVAQRSATEPIEHWISSPQFEINERFDRSLDELHVGDAIRRTITLQADSLAAMMLPVINDSAIQDGLAAYPKPAQLEDRVNRGTYRALRRESITYVAETSGTFTLPAKHFWWWNTDTRTVQKISLDEHSLFVSAASSSRSASSAAVSWLLQHWLATILIVVVLGTAVLGYFQGWWQAAKVRIEHSGVVARRKHIQKILHTYNCGEHAQAVYLIRHWFADDVSTALAVKPEMLNHYQQLLSATFGHKQDAPLSNKNFETLLQCLVDLRKAMHQKNNAREINLAKDSTVLNPR